MIPPESHFNPKKLHELGISLGNIWHQSVFSWINLGSMKLHVTLIEFKRFLNIYLEVWNIKQWKKLETPGGDVASIDPGLTQ